MKEEWEQIQKQKQPVLQIIQTEGDEKEMEQIFQDEGKKLKIRSLPWSEEDPGSQLLQKGYDGELNQMTFNHVVKSSVFDPQKSKQMKESRQYLNQL